jgi:hypothetical protein
MNVYESTILTAFWFQHSQRFNNEELKEGVKM